MKLHDLKPPPGSQRRRIRVGRGIAAGRGKTAGRGTKGQKSRSGASVPGWFEGGQTPIHVRVPKLRGFRNINRIDYQVVNVGRISEYAAAGRFGSDAGSEPITVNAAVLATAGLIIGLPLIVLVAIAVRLTSRGPVFYHQSRVGLHGRVFTTAARFVDDLRALGLEVG